MSLATWLNNPSLRLMRPRADAGEARSRSRSRSILSDLAFVKAAMKLSLSLACAGCPVRQEIVDSSTAFAYGDGLAKALEGQEAMFYVESRGQRGDLVVQVDGLYAADHCCLFC